MKPSSIIQSVAWAAAIAEVAARGQINDNIDPTDLLAFSNTQGATYPDFEAPLARERENALRGGRGGSHLERRRLHHKSPPCKTTKKVTCTTIAPRGRGDSSSTVCSTRTITLPIPHYPLPPPSRKPVKTTCTESSKSSTKPTATTTTTTTTSTTSSTTSAPPQLTTEFITSCTVIAANPRVMGSTSCVTISTVTETVSVSSSNGHGQSANRRAFPRSALFGAEQV